MLRIFENTLQDRFIGLQENPRRRVPKTSEIQNKRAAKRRRRDEDVMKEQRIRCRELNDKDQQRQSSGIFGDHKNRWGDQIIKDIKIITRVLGTREPIQETWNTVVEERKMHNNV